METGIRYGVIPVTGIDYEMLDKFDIPKLANACPYCGATGESLVENEDYDFDYVCDQCDRGFTLDEMNSVLYDEYDGDKVFHDDGFQLILNRSCTEIWVIKSPWCARGGHCSPCAPGAIWLGKGCTQDALGYCLDKEWFTEDWEMQYIVEDVAEVIAARSKTTWDAYTGKKGENHVR